MNAYVRPIFRPVLLCLILTAVFLLSMAPQAFAATGLNVDSHSQEEIRAYIQASGAKITDPVEYAVSPSVTQPYAPGVLTQGTLNSALAVLNQVRYIAGLDYDVKLDEGYSSMAQAASLVNWLNEELSHQPTRPWGVDEALYKLAYDGASHSNIAMGCVTFGEAIIEGWMWDGDEGNIQRIGHRRWILNPRMEKTGFGMVSTDRWNDEYSAMYALDWGRASSKSGVVWPAQNMPIEYFYRDSPWSVTFQNDRISSAGDISVKLTRTVGAPGTWTFSRSAGSDGFFDANYGGYSGSASAVIFRPNGISYSPGDTFQVNITGNGLAVSYDVNFFSLSAESPGVTTNTPGSPDATTSATAPKGVAVKALSAKKRGQIQVTWKAPKGVSGYQILLATDKKFKKNKRQVVVTKGKTTKKTITKLKKGKTYYVKIRAYKTVNGKKVYGVYGAAKKVRVK